MKKFIITFIVIVIIAAAILILPDLSSAQPPPPPSKPTQTPIDGGLGLLAAAGGTYAVKKLRDKKKE